jgi:cysteinyl-tRNA synthetase
VFDVIAHAGRRLEEGRPQSAGPLQGMLRCLGLENLLEPEDEAPDEHAQRLLAEREQARAARDFATADARRDQLAALGWQVRDTPEGPRLVRSG